MKKLYANLLPILSVQLVKSPLFPKVFSSFVVRTIQLLFLLALPLFSQGQAIDFDGTTTYTQDFQSITATALTAATTSNTTMLQVSAQTGGGAGTNGWYMYQQTGTGRWGRSSGSANTGSFYGMYDAAGTPNRAFGSLVTASSVGSFGVVLKNTSGARINEIVITYDAMINRNPSTTANAYPLSYRVSSSNIAGASSTGDGTYNDAAGTWTSGTGFTTPASGTGAPAATQAAITPLFRIGGAAITQTLSNLSWNNNEYLYIRWKDTDESGGDALAGIDNFSLTKVPFAITGQPRNQYDCTSNTASFSVTATGASSYQWFRSSDNGANWVSLGNGDYGLISGVTTATLVASGGSLATLNGTLFRCRVSDGSTNLNSEPARFTQGLPATSIQYTETAYCTSANEVDVAVTGALGGTFSATPAGLTINTSSGLITPASSTPNTYTILYSVPAQHGCAATSATTTVIITSNTAPSISYGTDPLCFDVTAVPVSLSGVAGGVFSALPSGLSINSITGTINPAASTAGEYTVTYATTGSGASGCTTYTTTTTVTTYTHLNAVITGGGNHACAGGSYNLTVTGTPNSIVTYKINDGIDLFLTLDNTGTTILNTGPLRSNTSYQLVAMRFANTLLCARTLNSTANLTFDRPYLTYAVSAPASACVGDVVNIEISNRPFTIFLYQINGGMVQSALINNNTGLISIPVTVTETLSFTRFSSVYQGAPNCSTTYPDSAAIVIVAEPGQVWYKDTDNDGYAETGAATLTQCIRPAGYKIATELLASSGDCNDNDAAIKPGATEINDGIDNNCDGIGDACTDLNAPGPVIIVNSTCSTCALSGGGISAPAGSCPVGSTLQYKVDNGPWTSTLPTYNQTTTQTIKTRCSCDGNPSFVSDSSAIATTPGVCTLPDATISVTESAGPGGLNDAVICSGNPVILSASGGGTYLWSTLATASSITVSPGGSSVTYTVTVTAPNGCTGSDDQVLTILPNPTGAITVTENSGTPNDGTVCSGTQVTLAAPGGFSYSWSTNLATTSSVTITPSSSTYRVTVTNSNNCRSVFIKPIVVLNNPNVSENLTHPTCANLSGGAIDLTVTSGTASYTFAWSDGPSTTEDRTDLPGGMYAVTVTDASGCTISASYTLNIPSSCCPDLSGPAPANVTIVNSTCTIGGTPSGGSITAPGGTPCPPGSTLQYQVNGGSWSAILPVYDQDGPVQSIKTRCACDAVPATVSAESEAVSTVPVALSTFYADVDSDGFGDPLSSVSSYCQPFGYVADNTDCDDLDVLEKPGQIWYADVDNDGYSSGTTLTQCLRPLGYKVASELTATSGDCNDNNFAIKPGATEICDGIDNNCNGATDEGGSTRYYYDFDGDGYGEAVAFIDACAPSGLYTATVAGDCLADDASIYPGATEICDGKDNNCNGLTDEGLITRYFYDNDGDGYGQNLEFIDACAPSGFYTALLGGDCNDSDVNINPGATEVCNDIDDNCDGIADEGFTIIRHYYDADGDGFGESGAFRDICGPIGFYTATVDGDCNGADNTIYPGAPELCDGKDNNCNDITDEGVTTTYYSDADHDGFGDPTFSKEFCSQPSGYVTNNNDCNDSDPLEKPGQVWYADMDNDGYSSGTTLTQCLRPVDYKVAAELTATSGDCNDNEAAINPAATEICDGIDNNCNGTTDEGGLTTYYADADNDGFGNPAISQQACSQPSGYVPNNTDCDDNDAFEKPGQIWYADADNDGYSSSTTLTQCLRPLGYKVASELTATSGDCNDNNFAIKPGATEICDGIDNNCNGSTDEGVSTRYYYDLDGDGYGEAVAFIDACAPSGLYTATVAGDCRADDADINPGATEICDGKDNDCNGQIDEGVSTRFYYDLDGDGYGEAVAFIDACAPSGLYTATVAGDCLADDADINPGATEICDGKDNDCNGQIDEGVSTRYFYDSDGDGYGQSIAFVDACAPSGSYTALLGGDCNDSNPLEKPGQIWYADVDNDGYPSGTTLTQCLRPVGYKVASELTATSGDCNDNNFAIKPSATEICDGIDNNCNGSTDEGGLTTYYADTDNDGFGNPSVSQQACSQPSGYVTNNTDCDDNDVLEKPGQIWYADVDNDGYSSGTTLTQCLRPVGYKIASELTATSGDCNDNNAAINPNATEVCDGVDNNCDGVTDEGCTPPMVSIHDPCTCMNNSPLIENGTTTNAGTFSETVEIQSPAGQTWTIVMVTGLYSDVAGTLPYTTGTNIPETGAGTGVFELSGYHRDGQGYTIFVTNGDTTLSIGNTCYYPDPVFTGLPALISPNAAPFTVTGTVANNAAGTGTFILDGVPQAGASPAPTTLTINPATLSVGTHTLVYSFDAGAPGAADPNDPGCVQQVQQRFRVAHCGCQDVTVSLNENCQFLLTGNLVSDVNCGGGTVRVMDNDPSNGGLIDCAGVWTYGLFDAFGNIICWGKVTAEDKTAPALVCAPADFTLDCYDVNYVLNNRLTIGNVGATSSPRPAATSPQTINNAEGVAGTGDACQLGLIPPVLVSDNIKNLGYAYFKDNCYNCGCRITLKWSDKVEFYSCEQMKVNGGYYALISREWTATDCNGMRSSYVQKIKFTRPTLDDFVFNGAGEGKYDRVVEYNSCTPDKSLIKKEDVTPYVCSYFNTSANPRCLFIDQVECNYSVSIKDTEFPICGGKGVKIDRELYVLDWCAGGIVDTFHILIKIGDFQAPTVEYAHGAPYDISTGPMDCTAAIPVSVAGIKTAFGVTIKDNCNLGNISVSVYTKDRYVKGILVYEGPEDPLCEDRCLLCGKQGELRGDHDGYQLGSCDKDKICWDKVEYAVMNGMMVGLPVGKHLMVIDAFDGCYNASSTCFVFEVKDKIAPIMKCDDDLHVTLSNANGYTNGYAQVSAEDIDEGSWDNCKLSWIAVRRNVPDGCAASFIQKGYDTNGNGKLDALPADGDVSKADGFDRNGDGDIADFGETFILKGGKLMTPLLDFVEFFCCDLTERVTVELWGGDIYGNTNYCWMDLLIEDKVAPTCLAPWDVTVYCDDKNIASIDSKAGSAAAFGDVIIPSGNDCAALDTVYSTEKKLKCGAGYIDRIWTLTKQTVKGPISVTCKQRIHILPVHEYNICFPKDVSTDCKTPIIDTVITDELGCDILAVNVHDKRYDASDDECYKIFRTYSVINWCTYDDRCGDPLLQTNISIIDRAVFGNYGKAPIYVLVRDREDNRRDGVEEFYISKDLIHNNADDIRFKPYYCEVAGEFYHSFIYTQIIKVYDDTRPVVSGVRDTFCTSPTACTANITKVVTLKDNCTDKVELETQFLMIAPFQTLEAGKMIMYSTPRWSTKDLGNGQFEIKVSNLPEGTHDLIVVGRDECGNLSLPTRIPFVVKDCKAPAPICINGLSTGIMPDGNGGGMMAVWASDFVASKIYDCNGQGPETKDGLKLVTKYSINRVGSPVNKDQTGLNFTCTDINNSPILVELHAWDDAGNHDFCITFVELIDSRGVCPGSANGVNIAGTISTEGNANLQGASITLSGAASQNATTAANGGYSFVNLAKGGDFTVTPQLDKNHLNGVSTFDLVLIQKHILGVQALNSPYKMIAADANNSKTISTLDLIALRKLILNIDTHFANNTSWRFVDATYVFPNPTNPWSAAFPEVVSINDIASNVTANFVAIKVGDVNASASVSGATSAEIRTSEDFKLKTLEQNLKSGNEYKVTFNAEDLINIQGYQFALNLDQSKVELLDIEYGVAKAENFGIFKNEGIITTSWNSKYEPGALFTLVLRAKADAKLSNTLSLNRVVSPEAYNQNNENLGIALNYEGISTADAYELRQNTPNPFSDETVIGFTLPKALKGTLTVRDVKGALIYKVEGNYARGNNQVTLKKSQLGASGVLYYTLETKDFTATKKMVILE